MTASAFGALVQPHERLARRLMGEKVIIKFRTFMDGQKPPDRVLPSML